MASPCQDLPSQMSVASGRLRRIRCPVMPTAMHSDVVGQETLDSPVATGGRLNAAKAPPACKGCCRAPFPIPADPAAGAAALDAARNAPQPTAAMPFRPRPARFRTTRMTLTRIHIQVRDRLAIRPGAPSRPIPVRRARNPPG